ncbi:adenylate/guanylate cyclase domain-containing protein [Halanaerocella petrolearia]
MIQQNKWLLIGAIVAGAVIILLSSGLLEDLELLTYDYRLLFKSLFTVNKQTDIVIVTIDKQSLTDLGSWPWPRSYHAQLINRLNQAGAKVIGFDILFDLPSTSKEDNKLQKTLAKYDNIFLPYTLNLSLIRGFNRQQVKLESINHPLKKFKKYIAGSGYLNLLPDRDGKIRKVTLLKEVTPFAIEIAKNYNQRVENFTQEDLLINYHYQTDYFPQISYSQVLAGKFSAGFFQDKLVLVGATADTLGDYLMTPLAIVKGYLPGVRVHAEIIGNYLEDSFIYRVDISKVIMLLIIFSLLLAYIYQRSSLLRKIIIFSISLIVILAINLWLLIKYNLNFPLVPFVLVSIFNLITTSILSYLTIEKRKERLQTVFARYLAPEIIEEVINLPDRDYLKGQHQDITILFLDLVGFTEFAEGKRPTEVVQLLNRYLDLVTEETFNFEGTLDKFLGDGAMIFFGAPKEQVDHAQRAVKLALKLKRKVNENNLPLDITIGLNTGQAVVGNIGSTKRSDYTAIGDVVNTAARIESKAQAGEILISATTYQLVEDNFIIEFKEEIQLKGKKDLTDIYQIKGRC